jgi:predicted nuclease of predicted toxin-antitoxin system
MNFWADANLPFAIVERLRQEGYLVRYVAEMEPGIPDDIILNLANQEESILLTADKDFGELVFRLKLVTFGVVLIRLLGLSPQQKAEIVSHAMNTHAKELIGAFTVITSHSIRIRKME